jgi:hypothetical protein
LLQESITEEFTEFKVETTPAKSSPDKISYAETTPTKLPEMDESETEVLKDDDI